MMSVAKSVNPATSPVFRRGSLRAFTLLELLVVIAIIAVLAALMLPSLASAKVKAKAVKAISDLRQIGFALEMYSSDHNNAVPPVRVNCNTDLVLHWCQLPIELAQERYLPSGSEGGLEANFQDVFNPGFTYKYGAPGLEYLNGNLAGNYQLWLPNSFPDLDSNTGKYISDPKKSPVKWVAWSMGPKPNSGRSQDSHSPMSATSWYGRRGTKDGVIVRYALTDGTQRTSE